MTWRISFGNPYIVICMIVDEVTLSSGQGTKRKDPAVDRCGVKSVSGQTEREMHNDSKQKRKEGKEKKAVL